MYQLNNTLSIREVQTLIVSELEVGAISAVLGGSDRAKVGRRKQKTHVGFWNVNVQENNHLEGL